MEEKCSLLFFFFSRSRAEVQLTKRQVARQKIDKGLEGEIKALGEELRFFFFLSERMLREDKAAKKESWR